MKLTDAAIQAVKALLAKDTRTHDIARMLKMPKSQVDNLAVELGYRTPSLAKGWQWPAVRTQAK